jgi:asparagine synthase (glutamine-hydrolysing)
MCGIAGAIANLPGRPVALEALRAASVAMSSRGPDGSGEWVAATGDVGLAHRRLAIIDLHDHAAQPMSDPTGRYRMVFNGEIYNYRELRAELAAKGVVFATHSDTEVILQLFARDGEAMLHRLRGMFAIAIWDDADRSLFLARDPYGIKPLYYTNFGGEFRFASQVKALLSDRSLPRQPDPVGYAGFRLWGSVPEPHTMFAAIRALPAGHMLKVRPGEPVADPREHASIAQLFASEAPAPTEAEWREALLDSVRHHLVADVEVGCFLSGGVDSGALVGLMRDVGQEQIRTITLAFDEFRGKPEDETGRAVALARHYGVDHTIARITRSDFSDSLPAIMAAMDQPTIDGVNSWFVSRAAHDLGLKVALSGLGGDELLAGYSTFTTVPAALERRRQIDGIPLIGTMIRGLVQAAAGVALSSTPKARHVLSFGDTVERAYLLRRSLVAPPDLLCDDAHPLIATGLQSMADGQMLGHLLQPRPADHVRQIATLESAHYMRNQLLRDTDWASMAHSLEVRVPLVDVVLAGRVAPGIAALRAADGKRILGNAPTRPLPDEIMQRSKTGFSIPVGTWLRQGNTAGQNKLFGWADRVLATYGAETGLDAPL